MGYDSYSSMEGHHFDRLVDNLQVVDAPLLSLALGDQVAKHKDQGMPGW